MGISYNPSIPATNDDPADDQPLMQANFASINTLINVDHVGFSNAKYGQHNQVTFATSNPPSVPTTPPVLFTNIVDGAGNMLPGSLAELFFYSGANTKGQNQYVSTANGSVLLLGGIVLKWGSAGLIGSPLSFPVPFPTACFAVLITGTSTLYAGGFVVTAANQTTFTVQRTSGVGNTGYYYLAIGN